MRSPLEPLQALGRALMLPIAVLPIAGLILRLGQPDLLNIPFVAAAGDAIFSNLGLLFAMGVAVGFARENNGAAGLAGVVCYLVATKGAEALLVVPPSETAGFAKASADLAAAAFRAKAIAKLSVPIGIISGVFGGVLYNRFWNIKPPEYLAFFGGRRFVPIVCGLAGLILGGVIGLSFMTLSSGVDLMSRAIAGSGLAGLFVYGVLNRLLLVTGLHHILNNVVWFVAGDYHGAIGDLHRFFAGDPTAGSFMAGFFPVMMFGLPAACLAMYHAASPQRRKAVGGMLMSLALTSFLTGVTEPIEFSFLFLAPALFAVHAALTGAAMALMQVLGVKLGFGFSAGLIDYVLNFGKATRPWLLLPVGLVYAALYYGLFRACIHVFDLRTPGREVESAPPAAPAASGGRGPDYVAALGGAANLRSVDACTTRLRLLVADAQAVDEARLRALGARGLVRPSANALQVVLGPEADLVASEIRSALGSATRETAAATPQAEAATIAGAAAPGLAGRLLAGLGGARNVRDVTGCTSRLRIRLADPGALDGAALKAAGARVVALVGANSVHLVLGPNAEAEGEALRGLLSVG